MNSDIPKLFLNKLFQHFDQGVYYILWISYWLYYFCLKGNANIYRYEPLIDICGILFNAIIIFVIINKLYFLGYMFFVLIKKICFWAYSKYINWNTERKEINNIYQFILSLSSNKESRTRLVSIMNMESMESSNKKKINNEDEECQKNRIFVCCLYTKTIHNQFIKEGYDFISNCHYLEIDPQFYKAYQKFKRKYIRK